MATKQTNPIWVIALAALGFWALTRKNSTSGGTGGNGGGSNVWTGELTTSTGAKLTNLKTWLGSGLQPTDLMAVNGYMFSFPGKLQFDFIGPASSLISEVVLTGSQCIHENYQTFNTATASQNIIWSIVGVPHCTPPPPTGPVTVVLNLYDGATHELLWTAPMGQVLYG